MATRSNCLKRRLRRLKGRADRSLRSRLSFCGIGANRSGSFAFGQGAGDAGHFYVPGYTYKTEQLDRQPGRIEFVPSQAVAGGSRMGVVVIVPAFAEGDQRDPPGVAGVVTGG